MSPHICLLYQKTNFPFIFEDAARLGVELTLAHRPDERPPAGLPAVARLLPLDIDDEKYAVGQLIELRARHGLDGLLTLWEGAVPFVARAASQLGLPGIDPTAAALTRDKSKVRKCLQATGLNCPQFVQLRDSHDFLLPAEMRFPVVVKPAHGFGSLGVIRANDIREVCDAVDQVRVINDARLAGLSSDGTDIVVEEYIDGPEYVAETFAINGEVHVLSIGYKGYPKGPYFEESVYLAQALLPHDVRQEIEAQVRQATLALGITSGPTHTELRLRDGKHPYVLEIGARLGGSGGVADMVRYSTGIDFSQLVFAHAIGDVEHSLLKPALEDTIVALFYIIPVGAGGIISEIEGLDALMHDPATTRFVQFTKPGGELAPYPDFRGYAGMIYSRHPSYAEAEAYLGRAQTLLKVRYA